MSDLRDGRDRDTVLDENDGVPAQAEVLVWVAGHWPNFVAPVWRAGKVCEEAGEVMGAVIKSQEGVGGKTKADVAVETAQLVLCAMALAAAEGFDLWAEIAAEWDRCRVREWPADA